MMLRYVPGGKSGTGRETWPPASKISPPLAEPAMRWRSVDQKLALPSPLITFSAAPNL
jgi:hypothetical protein